MKNAQRLFVFLLLGMLMGALSLPAYALELDKARSNGLVGETQSGYLKAIVKQNDVETLVRTVNARRSEEYRRIASGNGQAPEVVGKLAARQIIQKLTPGAYYEAEDGSWKKR